MERRLKALLLLYVLASAAAGGATTFPVTADVVAGTAEIQGQFEASADVLAAVTFSSGSYAWDIQAAGELRVYNSPVEYVRLHQTPGSPPVNVHVADHPLELLRVDEYEGFFGIQGETGKPFIQWLPNGQATAHCQCSDLRLGGFGNLSSKAPQAGAQDTPGPHVASLGLALPHDSGGWVSSADVLASSGAGRMLLFNVEVNLDGATVWTGSRLNETRSPLQVGPLGGHFVLDRIFLVVEGDLAIQASGTNVEWATTAIDLHGDVDALLLNAHGRLSAGHDSWELKGEHLQVMGGLDMAGDVGEAGHWSIEGDGRFVGFDTAPVLGQRSLDSLGLALGTAVVVGAAGWAAWHALLPRLVGLLVGGRVEDPMAHPQRAAIVRTLLHMPGQSHMELAKQQRLSRRAVRYHLQVLSSAGLLTTYRRGKIPRYMLNSGSSRFHSEGMHAGEAFAASAHPLRQAMLAAAQNGPLDYAGFLESTGMDLLESTFRYHCRMLQETGLLKASSEGWRLVHDLEELKSHYVRAFLLRQGWWKTLERLRAGECPEDPVVERLRDLGLTESQISGHNQH